MGVHGLERARIANATYEFQAGNRMPSLRSFELHEKRLAYLDRHKQEIWAARKAAKAKARATVSAHLEAHKSFAPSEMDWLLKVVGYCIGDPESATLLDDIERCMDAYPKKCTRGTYLDFRGWLRMREKISRRIHVARREIERCRSGVGQKEAAKDAAQAV